MQTATVALEERLWGEPLYKTGRDPEASVPRGELEAQALDSGLDKPASGHFGSKPQRNSIPSVVTSNLPSLAIIIISPFSININLLLNLHHNPTCVCRPQLHNLRVSPSLDSRFFLLLFTASSLRLLFRVPRCSLFSLTYPHHHPFSALLHCI
ncbi:hypothetical protein M431DRAFT_175900 [Trichoderma harzianum CBS 226.95]|uniref:Uncharacterized protein n=1 Tax=Trichoderma harzianum CBS 226.95 TaxID=983964 RepID=A0A2T4AT71_TRIHA|nr:hypothetical protein M431DRAFT_175900 [Trichoderma harzianum CBS 226.95]PTB60262.1 hypothetical protein M431DRAFT_175900 [Trichoderma harzianum CBS 226.95]